LPNWPKIKQLTGFLAAAEAAKSSDFVPFRESRKKGINRDNFLQPSHQGYGQCLASHNQHYAKEFRGMIECDS